MPSEVLRQELNTLAKRSVFLNIAAYLVSVIVLGVTISFAAGLVLGTGVLFGTLLILRYSVLRMAQDAKRAGVTSQRRYLILYGARLLLFAVVFGTAVVLRRWISPVAVAVPMLYPRLIYTGGAVLSRFGSESRQKKR